MKNLSDYSEFSLNELINKISTSRYWNLPKMLAEALRRLIPQEPKYKVYTALLTQSGTDAPVATVLENTLGETISFSYVTPGYYSINTTGEFPQNKTTFSIKNVISSAQVSSETYIGIFSDSLNINTIDFTTLDNNNISFNNILLNTPIEIRVYN